MLPPENVTVGFMVDSEHHKWFIYMTMADAKQLAQDWHAFRLAIMAAAALWLCYMKMVWIIITL